MDEIQLKKRKSKCYIKGYTQYCVVQQCKSRGTDSNKSFFKFPSDPIRKKIWLQIIKNKYEYKNYFKICSDHFLPNEIKGL